VLWCFHRVGWTRRQHLWIGLQGFHDFGDAALKLRVAAIDDGGRVVFDSVGSAVVDAAVTEMVLTLAERDDAGTLFSLGA